MFADDFLGISSLHFGSCRLIARLLFWRCFFRPMVGPSTWRYFLSFWRLRLLFYCQSSVFRSGSFCFISFYISNVPEQFAMSFSGFSRNCLKSRMYEYFSPANLRVTSFYWKKHKTVLIFRLNKWKNCISAA